MAKTHMLGFFRVNSLRPLVWDNVYGLYYALPPDMAASFGFPSGRQIPGDIPAREETTLWQEQHSVIGFWNALGVGLGGWTVSVHHTYDPVGRTLYLGDGRRRSVENMNSIITTVAGGGNPPDGLGDGGPATEAKLNVPRGIAVGRDGSLYIADTNNRRIRRVGPDGIITTVAGGRRDPTDGIPATEASLPRPVHIDVGPDDSLYIVDWSTRRVRRVGPDRIITTVAGSGSTQYSGDGGPATQAGLDPDFVAVGPDGNVYISDWAIYAEEVRHSVRRVGPDGIITTFAGTGDSNYTGEGGPAIEAALWPDSLDVGPDGSLYIGIDVWDCIARVTPDGILKTVAGSGEELPTGDGGPAVEAGMKPYDIAVGPDGSLYIAEPTTPYNKRVRRVGPDGIITTVAGGGSPKYPDRGDAGPATAADVLPWYVATGPDGSLYISEPNWGCVRRLMLPMPGFGACEIAIPSEDGRMVYHFNPSGCHLRTVNALTGAMIYEFGYDVHGLLRQIEDAHGNVTTIERDSTGNLTAIIGPFGHRTALSLDANGYLATVTNPAGEINSFGYTGDGLLTSVKTPRGDNFAFTYDSVGYIAKAEGPQEHRLTLERTETTNGHQVAVTTALGHTTTYLTEKLSTGERHDVAIYPDNTRTEVLAGTDGTRTTILPDGTVLTEVEGPDPRFGMQAPILKSVTTKTPGEVTTHLAANRSAVLADPQDLMSLVSLTDSLTLNDNTSTRVFDAATMTFTSTSAEGRQTSGTIDVHGRPLRAEQPGFEAIRFAYDSRGRLLTQSMGSGVEARTFTFSYNVDSQLESLSDPLDRAIRVTYDAAWRLTSHIFPDGRAAHFGHDANGFVTSITPPGRLPHYFSYTPDNALKTYTPPDVGAGTNKTEYAYDVDGQPTLITGPDGQTMQFGYDVFGRLEALTLPTGVVRFDYDLSTGQLSRITAPDGGTVSFTYDGFLPVEETWAGAVAGTVARTFNNDLGISSESVNGAHEVTFSYDGDGLLIEAGELILNWDPQSVVALGTTLGNVSDTWTYNSFGQRVGYTATFGATSLYSYQLSYDRAERIIQRTETIEGATNTFAYRYDLSDRLVEVQKNGATVAAYTYDSNGNRLSRTNEGGTVNATCDAQDRLTQYGSRSYAYTANGELLTTTSEGKTTTYTYDVEGNLRAVLLPDGRSIEYVIDGRNRRIGKKVNGTLVQGFLYPDVLNPVAELDGANGVVSRFVYGSRGNVPDYMIKEGTTYRILSDHLGSPRLVVNITDGTFGQRMDYDEFGRVILDTNPGFQPFGFAGGLYDPDTGLVRFGARDYDPETGRWTAKDPIRFVGGDLNLYAYALNNPLNIVHPEGLQPYWLKVLAAAYDAAGYQAEAAELRRIDKAYATFGRQEYQKHGFFKTQLGCQPTATDLMRYLPKQAKLQKFRLIRVGAGKQSPGAYSHNAVGILDRRTNTTVAVLDPIVVLFPIPGGQFMRRDFSQQYNPVSWAVTRGFNYDPSGMTVGVDTTSKPTVTP